MSYPQPMKKVKKQSKPENSIAVLEFVNAAFDDYMAARVLVRAKLLVQGAILASSAIEKYCKAVMAFKGHFSRGHLKKAHWNYLANFDPKLYSTLNPEFFLFLQKCYKLRYPDSLPVGYNIVIIERELLAELDRTALGLHTKFTFSIKDRSPTRGGKYEQLSEDKDDRLFGENHFLSKEDVASFISNSGQLVYECRKTNTLGLGMLEAFYSIAPTISDGHFMREALKEKSDGRSFDMYQGKHASIEKEVSATCENCGNQWLERLQIDGTKMTFLNGPPSKELISLKVLRDKLTGDIKGLTTGKCKKCNVEQQLDPGATREKDKV